MSDTSTKDYARGYAAGRKRARADREQERMHVQREAFRREVFLAVLPELIRSPWQTDGKQWTTTKEFVDGARIFANMAAERFTYPVEPPPGEGG